MDQIIKVNIRALVPISVTGVAATSASRALAVGDTAEIERTQSDIDKAVSLGLYEIVVVEHPPTPNVLAPRAKAVTNG